MSGGAAGERLGQRLLERRRPRRRSDTSSRRMPSDSASACGARQALGRRSGPTAARRRSRAPGPSASAASGRRERRVDAAGEADEDAREAVLVDVVADAEAQRRPHLGLAAPARRRTPAARGSGPPLRRRAAERRPSRRGGAPGRRRESGSRRRRRRATGAGRCRRPAGARSNWRRAGHQLAGGVEHGRAAVEDQLVLAAHLVAEGEGRGAVVGARGEHAPRAGRPCRGGRARPRCSRSGRRRAAARSAATGLGYQMSSQIGDADPRAERPRAPSAPSPARK